MTRLDGRGLAGMVKMVTLYAGKSRVWTTFRPFAANRTRAQLELAIQQFVVQ